MSDRTCRRPIPADRPRPETVRLLAVGDLREENDFPALVDAFAALSRWVPWARLVIVGDGPQRSALEEAITEHGLNEAVALPGSLGPACVAELVQRAHVFVRLSRPAPEAQPCMLPSTLPAALASGLCVVATRSRVVSRLIVDGVNGLLVEPEEPQDLLRVLHLVVSNAALRSDLGAAAAAALHCRPGPPRRRASRRSA